MRPPAAHRFPTRFSTSLLVLLLVKIFLAGACVAEEKVDWKEVCRTDEVNVFEKKHAGSDLREFKGVGVIDCPPIVAKRVLDDVDAYPHFMPYVAEATVLSGDARNRVSYQRISPPLVGSRDYTVRVMCETRPCAGGTGYCNRWQAANELGPAEKPGVTRVKVTEGSWLLEPINGGHQTQATYTVFTDSGGSLPTMISNMAGKTAVPKVFVAVRKQALLPKYASEGK